MELKKLAVIDVGSNAVRLLISSALFGAGPVKIKRIAMIRVPVRLGIDAFTTGVIPQDKVCALTDTVLAFRLLMASHGVSAYRAIATSALRSSKNCGEIIRHIAARTGIHVFLISGRSEAHLIASGGLSKFMKKGVPYIYADVGGGSTEITLFDGKKLAASESFALGGVRFLAKGVDMAEVERAREWVTSAVRGFTSVEIIGSGGNINKVFRMVGGEPFSPLDYEFLREYYRDLKGMSYRQRVVELSLNPDRADVIVPVLSIFLKIMKWSGARQIYAPAFGLCDAVIREMARAINT